MNDLSQGRIHKPRHQAQVRDVVIFIIGAGSGLALLGWTQGRDERARIEDRVSYVASLRDKCDERGGRMVYDNALPHCFVGPHMQLQHPIYQVQDVQTAKAPRR